MIRRIASHYAFTPEGIIANPLVETDDGRIISVGRFDPAELDGMEGVEFRAGLLVPALVNAHSHLELSYLKGAIPAGCGFAGFAAGMGRMRNAFTPDERERAAAEADREMYEAGIGAVGDIANDASAFAVKERSRIRYRTFAEVFGLRSDNRAAAAELRRRPSTTLTPHSAYSIGDALFRELCREGSGVLSIHFMESPAERELYLGRGALHEWYASQGFVCDFLHYGSPARRLAASVPADRSVMLVHDCCVAQEDIDIIMEHFRAPVWWVLCPRSNDYISGLRPDVGLLRRNGLNICIGTDSLASNRSLSLLEELKMFADTPLSESLRWATQNGADALGLDGLGRLAAGCDCGLAVISGLEGDPLRLTPASTIERIA